MVTLNLPTSDIKIVLRGGKPSIFDPLRHRYVALTPEEWVRQNFVHWLVKEKGYPLALLANEVTIQLNHTSKRCDTILYNSTMQPRVIMEFKAPHIKITQQVFNQIARYNMVMHVDYLIISNGMQHFCCRMDYEHQNHHFLPMIPAYHEL